MDHPLGGKTSIAIGVMFALLAVPYASSKLARYRITPVPWEKTAQTLETAQPVVPPPVIAQGETDLKASTNEATVTNALPDNPNAQGADPVDAKVLAKTKGSLAIEDPTNKALDAFYARLAKTKKKEAGAVTRILHYGDSVITSDYVSGTMRRKMQTEFGDAGHGYMNCAKGWDWYFHNDVVQGNSEGWSSSRITGPLTKDGAYGIGGVTFTGGPGATTWFGTNAAAQSTFGKKVSRFDVYYMETPNGGEVEAKIGSTVEKFSTKGESKASKIKSVSTADGEARMTLKVLSGSPRLFGVALERDQPGVVYDALGANGGRGELLANMDGAHWKEQMDLRDPALVILHYGTNESEVGVASDADYEKKLRGLVDKLKAAAPKASILILAPLDRAENNPNGQGMRTKPVIKKLVALQKKVAGEAQVGFWNTYEAMGGEGSMATWVKKGLAGGDMTHPSPCRASLCLLREACRGQSPCLS